MARNYLNDTTPLSRFGVLVAQLESIVTSATHKLPDPYLCFDLLSDLISAIQDEPKESILLWQRKCEDALYSLLVLGARRPVRHLTSVAMAKVILKGDSISIYSRASSLQGFLSDGKKRDAQKVAGAAQCLGELYHYFGKRITSGLLETANIVAKLLKYSEDFVRLEAMHMLHNALEGCGGNAASPAYIEAFRIITRIGVVDKSSCVRIAAARCLKAFSNIGGPGLGTGEIENCLTYCVKALEDPTKSVRDAFAEALGALLALGMNPDAQVHPKGKSQVARKKLEGGLQKHLAVPFTKASGPRLNDLRVGISLSWVCFLQAISLRYLHLDSELQGYALQVMDMLRSDTSVDAQPLACVLYILRVGVADQMSEPTQRSFSVFLSKQLHSSSATASMRVAALRTLSYVLRTLGEVPLEFKEVLDDTIMAAVSHPSPLVRVEAALALRTLAEVDPSRVFGLISYAGTMLNAARENVLFERGAGFKSELESLHGQATLLASLISISRKLPLGYPSTLPKNVLEVCRKLLMESSRNSLAAPVEKEAGWMLLSSLLTSVAKEELHDQVFDVLAFWASTFSGNSEQAIKGLDLASEICVRSAAIDALTSFVKCFVSSDAVNRRILLQPVLFYLNQALSYLSQLACEVEGNVKASVDLLVIRILLNYQALLDPSLYTSDHEQIIQICTTPFREASTCEESSCLKTLLDKRDSWLGPWTPGRDSFEDELRSFQGGKSGVPTCVWEDEPPSFPQPETISKMLVNQMLLCFGTMFAAQSSSGMLSFLGIIDKCLKAGKRQAWHASSVTNICVGLLAGLKELLAQRSEPLRIEILTASHAIFQTILADADVCALQHRASAECLGLLARLGNDMFTARLTKQFLGDVTSTVDSNYAGSMAVTLGCIHRSAGGMALSSLVPTTVNVISALAKTSIPSLQIWSLHGLLLTIEASGLSYASQVQATLGLATDILLSEESGLVDLQQGVGRLINAIVAVIGPELVPGSIFFSRCKSAIAEISSCQETATLLESVKFTQQLVLFAPQAVTVHSHVLNLLPTLSSRQPTLRHLALSTLIHLIEKDPVSIIEEQIEETLFFMLDEETNTEIGNLARTTIMRLLYASCPFHPSHWLSIFRNIILSPSSRPSASTGNNSVNESSNGLNGEKGLYSGEDGENMVSSSNSSPTLEYASPNLTRNRHLRYRTRVFATECLSHLPQAVGENPAHFDLSLARAQTPKRLISGDWLVLQLQELISLAYQISTIQFEKMRAVGVALLCTIIDKFAAIPDPELPGHLLLEQYQAQLISAVRSALDSLSSPMLLEAGLQLAIKMLMSGIINRDQSAVKRIFSLISRPLDNFNDHNHPSYAEWVSCKIKVRLLTAHASLKCYMYALLRKQGDEIPDDYVALFSKSSRILGTYWLSLLKDYLFVRFHLHLENWKPFLDGIQSSVVSAELQPCLEEAWPVILQALMLDAVPVELNVNGSSPPNGVKNMPTSGYNMIDLGFDDFQFLWGFLLLLLFQEQDLTLSEHIIPVSCLMSSISTDIPVVESNPLPSKLHEILFSVIQCMSTEKFFTAGFLTLDACRELLQIFSCLIIREDAWDGLAVSTLCQIVQNCPNDFLEVEDFAYLASELCSTALFKIFLSSCNVIFKNASNMENGMLVSLAAASTLLERLEPQMRLHLLLPFLLIAYKYIGEASTEYFLLKTNEFVQSIISSLVKVAGKIDLSGDDIALMTSITSACLSATSNLLKECTQGICQLENMRSNLGKVLRLKLACSIEHIFSFAAQAFASEDPGESQESNLVLLGLLNYSIQCIQSALNNTCIQTQAVGLQVVKVILQKRIGAEHTSFSNFYVGELIGNFVIIVQSILKRTINKDGVANAGECLKILMLLLTLSKASSYQKGLLKLLLGVVIMIYSTSDSFSSQETGDLKHVVVKLVSQLAQVPSTAALIRDVLLEMEATERQQLQEMILASVVQDQHAKPMSSSGPALVIKLPDRTKQQNEEKDPNPLPAPKDESANSSLEEEEDDDDDDWDTFQSFPASGNENIHTQESYPENTTSSDGDSGFTSFSNTGNPRSEDKLDEVSDTIIADTNQSEESPGHHDDSMRAHQESNGRMTSDGDDTLLPNILSEDHLKSTDEHHNEASCYDDNQLTDQQPSELSMAHASVASQENLLEEDTSIP